MDRKEATGFGGNGRIGVVGWEGKQGGRACVPHHGAEALAGDGVPALVVRDGVALVGGAAMCAAAAHRRRLLPSPCLSVVACARVWCGAGGDGERPLDLDASRISLSTGPNNEAQIEDGLQGCGIWTEKS